MPDYGRLYRLLFNAVSDSLTAMEAGNLLKAKEILKHAQIVCEELYIQAEE